MGVQEPWDSVWLIHLDFLYYVHKSSFANYLVELVLVPTRFGSNRPMSEIVFKKKLNKLTKNTYNIYIYIYIYIIH